MRAMERATERRNTDGMLEDWSCPCVFLVRVSLRGPEESPFRLDSRSRCHRLASVGRSLPFAWSPGGHRVRGSHTRGRPRWKRGEGVNVTQKDLNSSAPRCPKIDRFSRPAPLNRRINLIAWSRWVWPASVREVSTLGSTWYSVLRTRPFCHSGGVHSYRHYLSYAPPGPTSVLL